jgi:hypothetical protein
LKKYRPTKRASTGKRVLVMWAGLIVLVIGLVAAVGGSTYAMQQENRDAFCASCHTEGEVTFLHRALSPAPADLASFHAGKGATRCIDCHSAAGIVGRYTTLTYGASDLISYVRGHYPQPAVQDTPIGDSNCLKCHGSVFDNQDFSNHFHVFLSKWQALDPADAAHCVDCHVSHDTSGDPNTAFLNQNTAVLVCQKCHAFSGQG